MVLNDTSDALMDSMAKNAGIDLNKKADAPPKQEAKAPETPAVEPVGEKPAEIKTETPAVEIAVDKKDNDTPEKAEPIKAEKAKAWYEDQETPASKKETIDEAAKKYEARAKEYEALLADPELEAFIAAKKSGKGIKDFYNEVVGTDIDSLTPENIYETKLKNLGLEGQELQEMMEEFNQLPKGKKLMETSDYRNSLKAQQAEKLKKFSASANAQAEQQAKNAEITITQVSDYARKLVGQKVLGVEMTPEFAHDISESVKTGFGWVNPDGSFNTEKFAEDALLILHKKTVVKANVNQAMNSGKEEILKEVHRPSKNETAARIPNETTNQKTKDQVAVSEFLSSFAPTKPRTN